MQAAFDAQSGRRLDPDDQSTSELLIDHRPRFTGIDLGGILLVLDLVRMYHNFTRHTNLPVYQGVHEYRGRILHEHALLAVLHQSTVGIHRAGSFREPYSRTCTVQRVLVHRYARVAMNRMNTAVGSS